MRTIKFRGRDENGKWWYGDLRHTMRVYGQAHILIVDNGMEELRLTEYWSDRIDPETVGQFTGLFDRNKKEIYEGDILQLYGEDSGAVEVRFVRGVFAFLWKGSLDEELPTSAPTHVWAKVIGNIHDNPELLKGGE